MRTHTLAPVAGALMLLACAPQPTATEFDPDDPQVVAAIDSIVGVSLEGVRTVDTDKVLSMASETGDFTFVTGDLMLSGLETLRKNFEDTYASLESQSQEILEKRVRLLSPDVALLTAVSEGTYTDKAGWTSEPIGMGHTIIFVRENGTWGARHVHQSIAR